MRIYIFYSKNGHCKARLYPFAGATKYDYIRPRLKTAATIQSVLIISIVVAAVFNRGRGWLCNLSTCMASFPDGHLTVKFH